jgi:hypothetical protein
MRWRDRNALHICVSGASWVHDDINLVCHRGNRDVKVRCSSFGIEAYHSDLIVTV